MNGMRATVNVDYDFTVVQVILKQNVPAFASIYLSTYIPDLIQYLYHGQGYTPGMGRVRIAVVLYVAHLSQARYMQGGLTSTHRSY